MNEHTDIERVLERWFDDGPTRMPDRVVTVVADRIDRQRQRRPWRLQWRHRTMNLPIKIGAAVAAVVILAVAAWNLMPGPSTGVGGTTSSSLPASAAPSPAASSSPSTAPSANAVFPTWYTGDSTGAGILPAGSQTTRSFVPRFTFTVPEGWVNSGDEVGFYGLFSDTPANQSEFAASGGLAQEIHMGYPPPGGPYFTCDAWEDNSGLTATEISASIEASEVLATSDPVDIRIGGLRGKQIDVQLDPGWTKSCPGDPPGFDLGDTRTRAILLDTPDRGVMLIILGSLHSAGHEAFLADAMPIVQSFQFDLTP